MGKGSNAAKNKKAREDKARRMGAKKAGGGGAGGIAKRAGMTGQTCQICRQAFSVTQRKDQLQAHVDSKHSKKTFADCFPSYEG